MIYYTATHLEDVLARHVFALVSAAGNELSAMDEKENDANRVVLLIVGALVRMGWRLVSRV
jgi:hypothetical protein